MPNFKSFGLPDALVQALEHLNITTPTPVQEKSLPAALEGRDVLATAQTGTGKTLAYLLPIVAKMQDNAHCQALILAPTRELAEQISNSLISLLGRKGQHDVALLIGGAPIFKQFMMLKKNPRFIIGTPGRIIDHLERGRLTLHEVKFLVLDEMDRMLDMGFTEALETILQDVPKERQTLMFSATLPPNIAKMSQRYLNKPEIIKIGECHRASVQIKQDIIKTSAGEKFAHLTKELEAREGSVIIFVKTKISADELAEKLEDRGHKVEAIHGDLRQRQRDAVIRAFRKGAIRIMVATDIAARGLDIPHIMHVVNYDLPQCAEDYIHRIGRTGRAGMQGFALSLVLPSEGNKWRAIHRLLNSDPSTAYTGDNQGGGDWEHGGRRRSPGRRSGGGRPYEGRSSGGRDRGRSFGRGADRSESSEGSRGDRPRRARADDRESGARPWAPSGDRRRTGERSEGPRFGERGPRTSESRTERAPRGEGSRFGERGRGASEGRTERAPRGEGSRFSERAPRAAEGRSDRASRGEGSRFSERAPRGEGSRFSERAPRGEGSRFSERAPRLREDRSTEGRRSEGGRTAERRASIDRVKTGERAAKSPSGARPVSVRVRAPKAKTTPRVTRPSRERS